MTAPAVSTRCCGGRCRRAQPPMLMRGGLTDRWYVVLRYKDLGDGNYEAIEKHDLSAASVEVLDRLMAQSDRSQLDAVRDDLARIMVALDIGDHARPYSAHEVVIREVIPAIERLKSP